MQFGNLIVKSFYGHNKNGSMLWLSECQCIEKTKVICSSTDLTTGKKDHCGCLTRIRMSNSKRKYNTYDLTGEYGIGFTNKGEEFFFDLEDYDLIKNYCWIKHCGYIEANSLIFNGNTNIKMHRLVMRETDKDVKVDHIYHKLYDNRKSELRSCSNAENCANHVIHKNNTSGKSGISWRKDNSKWRVRIWKDYKCYNIGSFSNYEDAVMARDEAEIKYFKEYRCEEDAI